MSIRDGIRNRAARGLIAAVGLWIGSADCMQRAGNTAAAAPPQAEANSPDRDKRIAELIQNLGAAEYLVRERAQADLGKLGLAAFEALYDAQQHRDAEIASRARYLIRGMQVQWFLETDSKEIKKILRDYSDLSPADRRSRVDKLLMLGTPPSVAAVCRLVRFETDVETSKYAALRLMERTPPAEPAAILEQAQNIESIITGGKRTASTWLRAFAKTLRDPAANAPVWDGLVKEELETLSRYPERTSASICRDLLRWQVKLLKQLQRPADADEAIVKSLALSDGSKEQLIELVDWLASQEGWKHVLETATRHAAVFEVNSQLLYRAAQAHLKLGDEKAGRALADKALNTNPDSLEEHLLSGFSLKEAGMIEWAENEFKLILKSTMAGSTVDLRTRFIYSEMLHDIGRDLPAAETLQGVVDAMEKDKQTEQRVDAMRRNSSSVHSRLHYFYAQAHAAKGEQAKMLERLDRAVEKDPTDADVLIALFRLPDATMERKVQTRKLINEAADGFRAEMDEARAAVDRAPNEAAQQAYEQQLATACNQFAWLVGNTIGDYDEAIAASKRSLELRPNEAGYLDTLARCYFTAGDGENAVRTQREAVRLDPHSGQLRRQLQFFEKEVAAKNKEKDVK